MTEITKILFQSLNLPRPEPGKKLPANFNLLTKKVDGNTDANHDGKIDEKDKNNWVEPEELYEEVFSHRSQYLQVINQLQKAGLEDPFEDRPEIKEHVSQLLARYAAKADQQKIFVIFGSIIHPDDTFNFLGQKTTGMPQKNGGLGIKYSDDRNAPLRKQFGSLLPKEIMAQPFGSKYAECLEFSILLANFLRTAGLDAHIYAHYKHSYVVSLLKNQDYILDAANKFCAKSEKPERYQADREIIAAHYVNEAAFGSGNQKISLIDIALEIDPANANAWSNKAAYLILAEKFEEAMSCCEKAIMLDASLAEAWTHKGDILKEQKKTDEANKCYEKALALNKNYAPALFQKGQILLDSGQFALALVCFDQVLKLKPADILAWDRKALAHTQLGQTKEADLCLAKIASLTPITYEEWYLKGAALRWTNSQEAIACFNQALMLKPNYFEALFQKGATLLVMKEYDEAMDCLEKVTQLQPNFASGWLIKGNIYLLKGNFKEALDCYDKALSLNPNYLEAWQNKMLIFQAQGKEKEALDCQKKIQQLKSKK